jgi:hypothetical protein
MTPDEITRQLEMYFSDNWSDTPIAWPNVSFTAPDGAWVRFNVLPDNSEVGEIKGAATRNGVCKVQIFIKPGGGNRKAAQLAGKVENLFHWQDIGGVYCGPAYTTNNGTQEDGAWYQVTVTIPWWAWVNE